MSEDKRLPAIKQSKQRHRHHVSSGSHYVTLFALIVSNTAVLALGTLLAAVLGMDMGSLEAGVQQQKIQTTQARVLTRVAPKDGGGVSRRVYRNVSFNGYTSFLTNMDEALDGSIIPESPGVSGTTLTGLFKYDANASNQSTYGSGEFASYHSDGTIQLSAGNYDFKTNGFDINVWNDVPCNDYDPFDPFPCTRPPYDNLDVIVQRFNDEGLFIDLLVLRLWDNSGAVLTSNELPQNIDLNDWEYVTVAAQGWSDPNSINPSSFWSFGGPIERLNW